MAETGYTPTLFAPALTWSEPMLVKSNQPLDNRTIVRTKADLVALADVAYGGMLVTVAEENKTYILKPNVNNIDKTNLDAWLTVQQSGTDPGTNPITPLEYVSNMDNWVVASNTSRVVDYLHPKQISSVTDLNNIYCVIKGGKPSSLTEIESSWDKDNWQAAGLYVVIPDGDGVKLHSLLSGGTIEGLQSTVANLSTTVANLSTKVDNLSTKVDDLSTLMGTAPEGGLGSTVIEMLLDLPVALSTSEVKTVWDGVFSPATT